MNNFGFVKFLQRYIATYNRKNQKAGFIPAKFEIKAQEDFVIFGMQGGHQLTQFRENTFKYVDEIFDKIIALQKQSNIPNFY